MTNQSTYIKFIDENKNIYSILFIITNILIVLLIRLTHYRILFYYFDSLSPFLFSFLSKFNESESTTNKIDSTAKFVAFPTFSYNLL